jgi:hypothetical protein
MKVALVDPHGFCEGVLDLEDRAVGAHPAPDGWHLFVVTDQDAGWLARAGAWAFLRDGRWRTVPEATRIAWAAASGAVAETFLEELERWRAVQAEEALSERELAPAEAPSPAVPERAGLFEPVEIQPELVVRVMTPTEALDFGARVAETRLYAQRESVLRRRAEFEWWQRPCWPLVWTWRGQPIQYETLWVEPTRARIGFTFHVDRERSHWFWRECERPVFAALHDAGVRTVYSDTRADRADWIRSLQETYGALEIGRGAHVVKLAFDVREVLARATGFPARRTAGAGWTWRDGVHALREAAEEELPRVRSALEAAWAGRTSRTAAVLRMLDERWHLDRGAVLVGEVRGELVDVFPVRERTAKLSSIATLMPWRLDDPTQGLLRYAATVWQQAAGYEEQSSYMPERILKHPEWPRHFRRLGVRVHAVHPGHGEPLTEYRATIADLLARPRGDWTR